MRKLLVWKEAKLHSCLFHIIQVDYHYIYFGRVMRALFGLLAEEAINARNII